MCLTLLTLFSLSPKNKNKFWSHLINELDFFPYIPIVTSALGTFIRFIPTDNMNITCIYPYLYLPDKKHPFLLLQVSYHSAFVYSTGVPFVMNKKCFSAKISFFALGILSLTLSDPVEVQAVSKTESFLSAKKRREKLLVLQYFLL